MTATNNQTNNIGDNEVIWRYMDFTKYVSLLKESALFFCSCEKMKSLDSYEGYYTKIDLNKLDDKKAQVDFGEFKKSPNEYRKLFLNKTTINCWHMNNCESAGMWKLYSDDNKGIAIKSNINKLKNALLNPPNDDLEIKKINYINYNKDQIRDNHSDYIKTIQTISNKEYSNQEILNKLNVYYYPLIFSKRKEFEHENELRIASQLREGGKLTYGGEFITVDLTKLIDEIIISPKAENWFVDLVKDITYKYVPNHKIKISKSKLFKKID